MSLRRINASTRLSYAEGLHLAADQAINTFPVDGGLTCREFGRGIGISIRGGVDSACPPITRALIPADTTTLPANNPTITILTCVALSAVMRELFISDLPSTPSYFAIG
jgi:hypothetical protein